MALPEKSLISAADAWTRLHSRHSGLVPKCLDVRSEGEFAQGAFPGFQNRPILTDRERHEVGLTYKREGQATAVRLGYDLVGPLKAERVQNWLTEIADSPVEPLVICWRGGMRSQIACDWIREAGAQASRVQGGYKALRNLALAALTQAPPRLLVLSGLTGSGKSELLRAVGVPKVDLEALARHRGSAFGGGEVQPSQATFENQLVFALARTARVLIEDESVSIGAVRLPKALKSEMQRSSLVLLESSEEDRLQRIYRDYVLSPLQTTGGNPETVLQSLLHSLERVRQALGGLETDRLRRAVRDAFARDELAVDHHREWITGLLGAYYDKLYRYSFERQQSERTVVFRGGFAACRQWIESQSYV